MTTSTGAAAQRTRPCALITGASSGLGEAFAERLAAGGQDLIVVARREDRLRALADRLRDAHGAATEVLVADLAAPEDVRRVEARIAAGPALDLLVNNAGFGGYRPFLQLDPDGAEELIRLQVLAVTRLARAALPAMVARSLGAVINVSSQLAFSAALPSPPLPPGRAVYAATKAYVNAFTQLLDGELAGTGVRVQALCPGVMRTEFYARMGTDLGRVPVRPMEPSEVVRASLAALQRGEVLCLPGLADASALDEVRDDERRILEQAWANTLAEHSTCWTHDRPGGEGGGSTPTSSTPACASWSRARVPAQWLCSLPGATHPPDTRGQRQLDLVARLARRHGAQTDCQAASRGPGHPVVTGCKNHLPCRRPHKGLRVSPRGVDSREVVLHGHGRGEIG